jgi:hypothetical protein
MPTLERWFQGKVQKIAVLVALDADTADDLTFGNAGLIFQEEVILEEWEVWVYGEIGLAQMNKHYSLKNRVRVQMNQLNLIVVEEAVEKFTGGKTKSTLEKGGQHHDFGSVESGDVFILSQPPLENDTWREKMVLNEFEECTLIHSWRLKHLRMRDNHSEEDWALVWNGLQEQRNKKTTTVEFWSNGWIDSRINSCRDLV